MANPVKSRHQSIDFGDENKRPLTRSVARLPTTPSQTATEDQQTSLHNPEKEIEEGITLPYGDRFNKLEKTIRETNEKIDNIERRRAETQQEIYERMEARVQAILRSTGQEISLKNESTMKKIEQLEDNISTIYTRQKTVHERVSNLERSEQAVSSRLEEANAKLGTLNENYEQMLSNCYQPQTRNISNPFKTLGIKYNLPQFEATPSERPVKFIKELMEYFEIIKPRWLEKKSFLVNAYVE